MDRGRKKAGERRRTRLEDYLEGLIEGFVAYDERWRMTYMNATAEQILGRRRAGLIGKTWHEAFPHAVGNPVDLMYQRVMRTRQPERMDFDYREPYGKWLEISASPVGSGGISVHFRDVSRRYEAEAQRRLAEEQLALVTDKMPALISYIDAQYRYRFANRQYETWFHRSRDEVLGRTMAEVLGEAAFAVLRPRVDAALRGELVRFESETPYRGGTRWIDAQYVPDRAADGAVRGIFVLVLDVTERRQAEARLREADRRKDEFLAMLAHELRNPLAPIRNAVQTLMLRGGGDADTVRARQVIDRQARQMTRLLDDLLDVNRISRGLIELRRGRVTLSAVLDIAVETSRPLIEAGGHRLQLDVPGAPLVLHADPVRLAQVFSNLLNNAARYTPDGGTIAVRVEHGAGHAEVSVRDTGIGIGADMLPRVFEMFSQAEPARERSRGGLGLGLALARGLVELHGGRIEARSDGPGSGAEFLVRLPLAQDAAKPAPHGAAEPRPAAARRRVLIVDDLKDSADSLAALVSILGHEARAAYDGESALAVAQEFSPEVVLLDLGMPERDGYDVCRDVRAQAWGRDARVIALTGWGQEEDRRRTREAGFDGHLVKPADPEALLKVLER
jgi:PAS domain S-box-containing protein